jgi:hypothetical protein
MEKKFQLLAALILAGILGFAGPTDAVSPSPVPGELAEKAEKGIRVKGETVCLFQSGTEDIKKEIHVNDILIVFREDRNHHVTEVGKIRILSYIGDDYLKGEVTEGEVQAGDIAKKGPVASLVISSSNTCK